MIWQRLRKVRRLTKTAEPVEALFLLDQEMESFAIAVQEDRLDSQNDADLFKLFGQLASHPNATPLVRDWGLALQDACDEYVSLLSI